MSWIEDTRDAVATAIEALPAFVGEVVSRGWVPDKDLDKMTGRETFVHPEERKSTITSRKTRTHQITVWVAILDKFAQQGTEDDQASSAQDLADAVVDLLGTRIGGAYVSAADQSVTTSPALWQGSRLVGTFIKLTLENYA